MIGVNHSVFVLGSCPACNKKLMFRRKSQQKQSAANFVNKSWEGAFISKRSTIWQWPIWKKIFLENDCLIAMGNMTKFSHDAHKKYRFAGLLNDHLTLRTDHLELLFIQLWTVNCANFETLLLHENFVSILGKDESKMQIKGKRFSSDCQFWI